jgi:hypothetical protein
MESAPRVIELDARFSGPGTFAKGDFAQTRYRF